MKITFRIMKAFTIALTIIGVIFFPIIPQILNYPPDSINNDFQRNIDVGMTYTEQYCGLMLICYIIGLIIIKLKTKKINDLDLNNLNDYSKNYLDIINSIFNLPYTIYLMHLIVPTIMITGAYAVSEGSINLGTIKIVLVFVTIETFTALVLFIYCKNLISNILNNYSINKKYLNKVISFKTKIFTIFMPMILVALLFTTILAFSQIINQKSEYMSLSNKMLLDKYLTKTDYSLQEINQLLYNIELYNEDDDLFIIYSQDEYTTLKNEQLSEFFIKYTIEQAETHGRRTYDTYGVDMQGVEKRIVIDGRDAYVGIIFDVAPLDSIIWFAISISSLFLINCIVLYYISSSIANDVKEVSNALNNILKDTSKISKTKLPITSNDEIAQLVIAFNEIQQLTDEHITKIEENQYTMQRTAQFAILGEFAGGLVHDLNSPLSAVQLDISTLRKYANSSKVTADDETRIKINGMLDNIDSSLNRMKTITVGIRNQIRSTGDSEKEEFLLQDVVDGLKILFRSILMNNNCQLETDIPEGLTIYGEKNKLDRVIGNMIKNSIDAYFFMGKKGVVKIKAKQRNDYTMISISDKAGGIDEDIKDNIFTEIKTTKAEKGTGFGLYYSNTIIESSFKGRIYFKTKDGVGTTFYIVIPSNKEEK